MLNDARLINPNYNEQLYKVAQTTRNEYAKMSPNSAGGIVQQINRAIPHMDVYADAASKLDNTNSPIWNTIKNEFLTNTGNVATSDVQALKGVVGAEVEKAIGGGKGVQERLNFERQFDANSKSGPQLQSVIRRYQSLIAEPGTGLKQNWTSAGLPAHEFDSKLVPRVREEMDHAEKTANNTRSKW